MIKFQRIIKYGAIALAFVLIGSIISGIMFGINSIFNFVNINNNSSKEIETIDISDNVDSLDIELDKVNLSVKIGNKFRVEISDNNKISCNIVNNKLVIREKKSSLFDDEVNLIIYILEDKLFNNVDISSGIGNVLIDNISSNKFEMELGMGRVAIDNLVVNKKTDIDTGVGEFVINDGIINNFDLDMGVGNVFINSNVIGKSDIDAGIGNLELGLIGSINDYKIDVTSGVGNILIDNKNIKAGIYGNGNSYLNIEGGMGDINVKFVN